MVDDGRLDRLRAKSVPDVIEGIVPSGIMTLAVSDDVLAAESLWAHGRSCVRDRTPFLGAVATRGGATEVVRPVTGGSHGLRPTVMYMATTLVWLDLTHLDLDEVDARLRELRDVFTGLALDHWHAVQPGFVVAIPDLFECGPFGVHDLAHSFFGRLALGAVYVDVHGEDAPAITIRGRERTLRCRTSGDGRFARAGQ